MFVGIAALDDSTGSCKITKVESITGEVSLQSRKQRRFALYELDIKLKWEGQLFDAEGKVAHEAKGTLRIEDLSEETLSDLPCEVTCDDDAGEKRKLKELMRVQGAKLAKAKALEWAAELKGLVAAGESSDAAAAAGKPVEKPVVKQRSNNTYVVSGSDGKSETARLEVDYEFPLAARFVYDSLLDTNRMRAATAADAAIDPKVGGKLTLFNGSVEGELLELVSGARRRAARAALPACMGRAAAPGASAAPGQDGPAARGAVRAAWSRSRGSRRRAPAPHPAAPRRCRARRSCRSGASTRGSRRTSRASR